MTTPPTEPSCAFCARPATVAEEPPRRTLARGADPDDSTFSITVILPDVPLCPAHAEDLFGGRLAVGWCDAESCRVFGELGAPSPCGAPYLSVEPGGGARARPSTKVPSK